MEAAVAESHRQPGASFTIDYLLFNKGKSPQEDLEQKGHEEQVAGKDVTEVEQPGTQVPQDLLDKPNQSYIALISTAILSSPEKKLLLSDIYQWIMDKYPYFKNKVSSISVRIWSKEDKSYLPWFTAQT